MEDVSTPQNHQSPRDGAHGVHPVVDAITAIDAALDQVADAAVWGLGDDDLTASLVGCERVAGRQAELRSRLVAEADGRDLGRRSGASSTRTWLRDRLRWRPGQAKWQLDAANRMAAAPDTAGPIDYAPNIAGPRSGREMPATKAALAEGAISADAAVVIARTMAKLPKHVTAEQGQRAEADLAGFARDYDPGTLAKLAAHLLHVLDIDTLDDEEDEQHRRRDLRLDEATGRITGRLDGEGMATVRTVLDVLARPQPAADGTPDPRTPGQRLADALVELARRALASDTFGGNHGISHRVLMLTGLDTLAAHHHCHHHGEHDGSHHGDHGSHGSDGANNDSSGGTAAEDDTGDAWVDRDDDGDDSVDDSADDSADDVDAAGCGDPADTDTDGNTDGDTDADTDGAEDADDTRDVAGDVAGDTGDVGSGDTDSGVGRVGPAGAGAAGNGAPAGIGWVGPAFAAAMNGGGGDSGGGETSECPLQARAAAGGIAPGEFAWGGPISAAAVRRITCFAGIQRVVLDPMGAVLDVGREYRTVTPAQYAALIARDGGCAFPGCTRPPSWCIAHHILHWADGGPTNLDNLVLLCTYHHMSVHHRGWTVQIGGDRLPEFTPPKWVDPDQQPRRNTRPRYHRSHQNHQRKTRGP